MTLKAKYNGNWHKIDGIEKSDDNINYKLAGVNKTVSAKDINDIDMDKGEVTNPDGSITRFPGKEQLKKPLRKSTSLLDKWHLLKAKLNHEDSFQDMDIFGKEKEEEEDAGDEQQADDQQPQPQADGEQPQQPEQPQQEPEDQPSQTPDTPDEAPDQQVEEQPQGSDQENQEDVQPLEGEELAEALKELGYSDAEVAYILHGHSPAIPSKEELAVEAHGQNLQQDQEGHKLTLGHRDEEHDVELEHKKKMQEIELEYSKREKELKLKHLEEELAIKRSKMKSKSSSGGAND